MTRWGPNVVQTLFNRETGLAGNRPCVVSQYQRQRELLHGINFAAKATTIPLPPATDTAGLPIVAKFNKNPSYCNRQLLAIGGEEGFITIANTEHLHALERNVQDGTWRPRAHWPCHRNSIFDLAWAKNDSVLYTASGHQQVGIWDTDTARGLAVAEGHEGSVKAISPLHLCEDIFATGARDGRIMLWDARCPGFSGQAPAANRRNPGCGLDGAPVLSPVWVQDGAHTRPTASGGRSSNKIAKPAPVTVTSVAFVPYSYLLASAGAQDTVVKLWDLRMQGLPFCDLELPRTSAIAGGRSRGRAAAACKDTPHEVAAYSCPTQAAAVGVTHITVSESGDRILVSCLDSQHHLFSLSSLAAGPCVTWRAPAPALKSSFYMRSAFSPCGDYVLSGSRDCGAHIWCVADPQRPAIELPHEQEVTGVAWCGGDWAKVATCSDTGEARVWTLSRLPARAGHSDADLVLGKNGVEGWAVEAPAVGEGAGAVTRAEDQQAAEVPLQGDYISVAKPASAAHLVGPAATALVTPEADKAATRRMVQSRLNLERSQRGTPVPTPPAPASAVTPGNSNALEAQPALQPPELAVTDAPAASPVWVVDATRLGPQHEGAQATPATEENLTGAAAVRASALCSPVSVPARPSAYPAFGRRGFTLPPVPVFSPALNHWQLREGSSTAPQQQQQQDPPPAASSDTAAARPAPSVCGGLEEAMKGLAHVRTQSPARLLQHGGQQELYPDVSGARVCSGARPDNKAFVPPPAQLPHAGSYPPSSNAPSAARAPAVSPHATPNSFCRSRSRLGPFSPSRSSQSSGGNSGGSGTPSGGGRPSSGHQAPQGVVSQILRNSPRLGGRASAGDPQGRSPRSQRSPADDDSSTVPRQLFPPEDQPGAQRAVALVQPGDWSRQPAAGAGPFAWDPLAGPNSGAAIVAAVDRLLQQPGPSMPTVHPSPRSRNPFASPRHVAYDIRDGEDVGPALRYRAMNPDENGPFEEVLGARSYGEQDEGAGADDHSSDNDRENAGDGRQAGAAGGHAGGSHQMFGSALSTALFDWEGLERSAQLGRSLADGSAGPADIGGLNGFDHWAVRRVSIGNGNGFLAAGGLPFGFEDDNDDLDWESDPYGDKENTPPPEPLDASVPVAPTSSASGGGGGGGTPQAVAAATRSPATRDLALPGRLLEPPPASSERRPGEASRLMTPFAAALAYAETAGATASQPGFTAQGVSSLHTEPTVSAGIAPSSGDTGTGDEAAVAMPSLGREWLSGPVAFSSGSGPVGMETGDGDRQATSPQRVTEARWAHQSGSEASGEDGGSFRSRDGPGAMQHGEHLTPTKRPRRAFSSGADPASPSAERSPSPTRRVRSSGMLPPLPTPNGKQRPGAGTAAVQASPCIRGSAFSSRGAGGSRLAPAAGAGYLIPGPAAAAAAGIGSESPMPKVGTASRTGRRATAASEEFFQRRAEEERDSANMSPFGFGLFSPAAPTPSGANRSTLHPHHQAPPSRLGRSGAPAAGVGLGSCRLLADETGCCRDELGAEDDGEAIESSVRSLSCVFETQTQGGSTVVVPCTFPEEGGPGADEEGPDGGSSGAEQPQRQRSCSQRPCSQLPIEERTVGSPHLFGMAARDGPAAGSGENGGSFEPHAHAPGGGMSRAGSIHFGGLFRHGIQQQQHPRRELCHNAGLHPGLSPLPLDENSRCFPAPGMEGTAATIGGALKGHGAARAAVAAAQWPFQSYDLPPERRQPGLVGSPPLLPGALSISSGGGGGASSSILGSGWEPQQQKQSLSLLDAVLPRLAHAQPMLAETGNVVGPAAGHPSGPARQQHMEQAARKPRQQTLMQCWGSANGVGGQQHGAPLGPGMPLVAPVTTHRALGPTGLTSPRYFR